MPSLSPLLPVRRKLLRDPVFIAVVAGSSLIQGSHAMFYGFTAMQWRGEGILPTSSAVVSRVPVLSTLIALPPVPPLRARPCGPTPDGAPAGAAQDGDAPSAGSSVTKVRSHARSFLNFCYTPELAVATIA